MPINYEIFMINYKDAGTRGAEEDGALPTDFGRLVKPISTSGDRLCPPF